MISCTCFLAQCHTCPPPKCKVAAEAVILSIWIVRWWIIGAQNSLTHDRYSKFICWVNKYVNHSNKWCATNFLGGIFFFLVEVIMYYGYLIYYNSATLSRGFSPIYRIPIYLRRYLRIWVRFICVYFISIAAFLSIFDPKK